MIFLPHFGIFMPQFQGNLGWGNKEKCGILFQQLDYAFMTSNSFICIIIVYGFLHVVFSWVACLVFGFLVALGMKEEQGATNLAHHSTT